VGTIVARAAASTPARAAPRVTDVAAVTQACAVAAAARTAAPAVPAVLASQPAASALPSVNSLFSDQDRSTTADPGVARRLAMGKTVAPLRARAEVARMHGSRDLVAASMEVKLAD
jgi:hypothetical protein